MPLQLGAGDALWLLACQLFALNVVLAVVAVTSPNTLSYRIEEGGGGRDAHSVELNQKVRNRRSDIANSLMVLPRHRPNHRRGTSGRVPQRPGFNRIQVQDAFGRWRVRSVV